MVIDQLVEETRGQPSLGEPVATAHRREALLACRPFLQRRRQNVLDIGPDPLPWLQMIERRFRAGHRLEGCVQNAEPSASAGNVKYSITPVELDIWSPLARKGLAAELPRRDYTLITALGLIDHLYHPEPFLKAVSQALRPGGILLITASNVGARENLLALLNGDGVAPDLDAVVGLRQGPRPRVRQYSWREIANAALSLNFVPVGHGFFDAAEPYSLSRYSGGGRGWGFEQNGDARQNPHPNPPPEYRERGQIHLPPACLALLSHRHQHRSHFYLLLQRTARLPGLSFASYMFRHAPRSALRYSRDRIAARIRAVASA